MPVNIYVQIFINVNSFTVTLPHLIPNKAGMEGVKKPKD